MFSRTNTLLTLLTTVSVASAQTYKSSFTNYGAGDTFGSGNCNTNTAACGFYDYPGFNAAASQNIFGVGPGAGAGPGCGTCWQLTPETDSSGKPLSGANSIIVKVNNLCPAQGNPLCAQGTLSDTNQYGANVNFDLCIDDGAAAQLFGSSGTQLALGSATEVDCSKYQGTLATTPSNGAVTGPPPSGGNPPAPAASSSSAAAPPPPPASTASSSSYAVASHPPASSPSPASSAPAPAVTSAGCGGGSSSSSPGSSSSVVKAQRWSQCGGVNWTGPTACEAPYTCQAQAGNKYYSQCL